MSGGGLSRKPSMSGTLSPRRSSFSVISSEEASEFMEWFDPEMSTAGIVASPRSTNTEFLYLQNGTSCCPASKMVCYYEERLFQLQMELDMVKARLAIVEYHNDDGWKGVMKALHALFEDILKIGTGFQIECAVTFINALSA